MPVAFDMEQIFATVRAVNSEGGIDGSAILVFVKRGEGGARRVLLQTRGIVREVDTGASDRAEATRRAIEGLRLLVGALRARMAMAQHVGPSAAQHVANNALVAIEAEDEPPTPEMIAEWFAQSFRSLSRCEGFAYVTKNADTASKAGAAALVGWRWR